MGKKLQRPDYVDTTIRVRYAETDRMGVVYYANYLVWFEVGRGAWCRAKGFSYRDMEEQKDQGEEGKQREKGNRGGQGGKTAAPEIQRGGIERFTKPNHVAFLSPCSTMPCPEGSVQPLGPKPKYPRWAAGMRAGRRAASTRTWTVSPVASRRPVCCSRIS